MWLLHPSQPPLHLLPVLPRSRVLVEEQRQTWAKLSGVLMGPPQQGLRELQERHEWRREE
jgi:hypothetical protein